MHTCFSSLSCCFLSKKHLEWLRQKRLLQVAETGAVVLKCLSHKRSLSTPKQIRSIGNNAPSDFMFLPQIYLNKIHVLQREGPFPAAGPQVQRSVYFSGRACRWAGSPPRPASPGKGKEESMPTFRAGTGEKAVNMVGPPPGSQGTIPKVKRGWLESQLCHVFPLSQSLYLSIGLISTVCLAPITCWVL